MNFLEKIWEFLMGRVEFRIKPEFHLDGQFFHDNIAFRVEDSAPKIPCPIKLTFHIGLVKFRRWITVKVKLNGNEWRDFFSVEIGID